jgi:predicted dehydrogenase
LKTIIFGAGRMGRRFIQISKNNELELAGICDINPEALAIAKEEYNLNDDQLFQNPEKMVKSSNAEVAIIATTAQSHFEYSMLSMDHGFKYILCEKPLAVSLSQCDRMIAKAEDKGVSLGVNHQMRHLGEYQRMQELLQSPEFGCLNTMLIQTGNAGLSMNGLHLLEMFSFLAGSEVIEVTGWIRPEKVDNPRGAQYDDPGGALRVATRDGHSLYLDMDTRNGHGMTVMAAGRCGQFTADLLEGTISISTRTAENRNKTTGLYATDNVFSLESFEPTVAIKSSTIVLRELLKGEKGDFVRGEGARRLIEILIGAYVSSENGNQPIDLDNVVLPVDREFPWA